VLQNAWDRTLERLPVLVLDTYLVTGGYPRLVTEATRHRSTARFVRNQLQDDSSPLVVVAQRVLSSEFRETESARVVLEAIGALEVGHATFSAAVARLGGDHKAAGTQVTRALESLRTKRMISIDLPVGEGAKSRRRRYRITDPYLQFWFRFCAPELAHIERGRADLALARYERGYRSWRGRAIEAVVHGAVNRLAADPTSGFAGTEAVGSWWDRTNEHEYDLVTTDRRGRVLWIGSVKWRTTRPMNRSDKTALATASSVIPGAHGAQLLAVCPAGTDPEAGFDGVLTARDILDAYRR
jgi:AAA+ ATPase superfamily predicted ATPase